MIRRKCSKQNARAAASCEQETLLEAAAPLFSYPTFILSGFQQQPGIFEFIHAELQQILDAIHPEALSQVHRQVQSAAVVAPLGGGGSGRSNSHVTEIMLLGAAWRAGILVMKVASPLHHPVATTNAQSSSFQKFEIDIINHETKVKGVPGT